MLWDVAKPEIWGTAQIAELLGVNRQRVHVLRRTYADFPKPVATVGRTLAWRAADVRAWVAKHPSRPSGVRVNRP